MKLMYLLATFAVVLVMMASCTRQSVTGYTLTAAIDGIPDGSHVQLFPVSHGHEKPVAEWTKALKEEQLQWPNFLDTEGIADIYKVKFVPTMYLIDAQGVMVGENLRGEALANKLAELFGEIE
jgi:hypothetical protein